MAMLSDYALQGQYSLGQQQQYQQAMLQQLVPQAWANSTAYTLQCGTDSTTATVTVQANPLGYYERAQDRNAMVERSNEAWLDERVNEMRVKL